MTDMRELPEHTLNLTTDDMRELGYRIIDAVVDHHATLPDKLAARSRDYATLMAELNEPIPEEGGSPLELLGYLNREVFSNMMYVNHPRFYAFVPGPSNFVATMADTLAAGHNTIVSEWMEASGPAALELVTIGWLRQLCGFPEQAGGLFVSGGSMANLTGVAVGRKIKLDNDLRDAVVYCSKQAHASNRKAVSILGFQPEQLVAIEVDDCYRLDVSRLVERIRADRKRGLRPFCIIGNAGTTNTGAIDPLPALLEISRDFDLWLHVDGAYGAAAVLTKRGQKLLSGLGEVDSLAIDPHKWLFQPFEIGCVLLRDVSHLRRTFGADHEYLQDVDTDGDSGEVNFCDMGVQLSRGFRALKLWMTFKTFGVCAIRGALDHTLELAEVAEAMLRERDHVEVCTPASLAIVSFRFLRAGADEEELNRLNLALVRAVIEDGRSMLSSTRLGQRVVLRLCTINPRTTSNDLAETLSLLDRLWFELT